MLEPCDVGFKDLLDVLLELSSFRIGYLELFLDSQRKGGTLRHLRFSPALRMTGLERMAMTR